MVVQTLCCRYAVESSQYNMHFGTLEKSYTVNLHNVFDTFTKIKIFLCFHSKLPADHYSKHQERSH